MGVIEISCLEVWKEISNYIDNDVEPGRNTQCREVGR